MHGARNVGGGEYSIYLLIKNLRKDIFEPVVFYSHENEIIRRLKIDGIRLIHIPLNQRITSVYRDEIQRNPIAFLGYFYYFFAGILNIFRALKQYNVDILHPHDNLSKVIGGIAAKAAGVKAVAHCRDLLGSNLIEKFLLYYQLLFMNRIIAVSKSNRDVFRIRGSVPEKVSIIYNGIDLKKFVPAQNNSAREMPGIKDGDIVIGIIGVFDKCKGHIYLFNALKHIVSEGRHDIVCLIIGDGREREELKRFSMLNGLEKNIIFLGYRDDIHKLLNVIDIIVIPSIQESFPRVALEAMAMEVPVIATIVGGLPESVDDGKTGILVPPADVTFLCRAIKSLIENPAVRKQMGEAGRKRVEDKFSLEFSVKQTEELYMNMCGI